jgi:hypothetical protein
MRSDSTARRLFLPANAAFVPAIENASYKKIFRFKKIAVK